MKRTQPDEVFLGRALIRRLHQAHADQIESVCLGLRRILLDPYEVKIRVFGATRTFIAQGDRWENQAVLTDNESP